MLTTKSGPFACGGDCSAPSRTACALDNHEHARIRESACQLRDRSGLRHIEVIIVGGSKQWLDERGRTIIACEITNEA
jgi:hypothetical protein